MLAKLETVRAADGDADCICRNIDLSQFFHHGVYG
jgi:hypothetical protein